MKVLGLFTFAHAPRHDTVLALRMSQLHPDSGLGAWKYPQEVEISGALRFVNEFRQHPREFQNTLLQQLL